MRVIGGTARGRALLAPRGEQVRPTADRVREALFDILRGEVMDARVLDLFAGTGALAIEALSRGARCAVLVDSSRAAADTILRNLACAGVADRARLIARDWRAALPQMAGERFTLVFLDPPYRMEEAYWQAARALNQRGMLEAGALIVMECDARQELAACPPFERVDARRYGQTWLGFFRRADDVADDVADGEMEGRG